MTASPEKSLRLLSYNVHSGIGRDRRHDLERIIRTIRECDADVVALQEVENHGNEPGAFLEHARKLGYDEVHYGTTMMRREADYGNMLLSRYPLRELELQEISWRTHEPRGLISAIVESPLGDIGLMATHFGLRRRERGYQTSKVMEQAARFANAGLRASILMGDLNEWRLNSPALRQLGERFTLEHSPPTFPIWWPFLRLDRILATPELHLRTTRPDSALCREASDHFPLIAEASLLPE